MAQAYYLSLQRGTQRPELPHLCSPTGNGAPAMGEVLGIAPQVFWGRTEETCPSRILGQRVQSPPLYVGIPVSNPDTTQTGLGRP